VLWFGVGVSAAFAGTIGITSDDGLRIVFAKVPPVTAVDLLYMMKPDGTNLTPLAAWHDENDDPACSPRGNRVAYTATEILDGTHSINVINVDGSDDIVVTPPNYESHSASWSPDGSRIAFMARTASIGMSETKIYLIDDNGSNLTQLTDNSEWDSFPAWLPNGNDVAFISTFRSPSDSYCSDLFIVNVDGSNLRQLTHLEAPSLISPAWSPDGSKMAFSYRENDTYAIYVMNSDGSNISRLTSPTSHAIFPRWSPDGMQIVFSATVTNNYEIFVMSADGSHVRQLTHLLYSDALSPCWLYIQNLPSN
jgi:Tol biopolymer transport system component